MQDLINVLRKNKLKQKILHRLMEGKDCAVSGLWGSSANLFVAAVARERQKTTQITPKILFVVPGIEEADDDVDDLNTFLHDSASLFPAIEDIFAEDAVEEEDILAQRLSVLNRILPGNNHGGRRPDIIVTPVQALLQPVPGPQAISDNIIHIRKNHELPLEELISWMQEHRYEQVCQVENPGEYALRGGIIDIFPYGTDLPCRIEYFGDEVESIRSFYVDSQLSEQELDVCRILSLGKNDGLDIFLSGAAENSLLDYLNRDTWIVLKEPESIENKINKITDNNETLLSHHGIFKQINNSITIKISGLPFSSTEKCFTFHVKSVDHFSQKIHAITAELSTIIESNERTIIFCNNTAEEQRFQEIIRDSDIADTKKLTLKIGSLHKGFQFVDFRVAVLAHHEIFHRYRQRRETKKPVQTRAIDSFLDLQQGDYVVHVSHGIGCFLKMETLESEGNKREYLVLEFAEGTKIYVPATKIELVQKYVGISDHRPKLDKINAKSWIARKKRTENAVIDVASELLHIQALRNAREGISYPEDSEWQEEFEASFLYEETPDQLQTIEEIKRDMESKRPMDRLICGDVGYGKTELAMRSAFKAVMYGKQVAVLVPTTILAQQHYTTFSERMADYPINIEVISRLKTRHEQKVILKKASEGAIDILIGTHRLVQKDVSFKDLGLVIIDEEQRFGVAHKERFKKLRQTVDMLTLTATPIPRTLHMSLMGIKDISSLNTAPLGRQAIHTQIIRFDPEIIRKAIMLELNRDGQVYFVHNRVYNIEHIAGTLSEIIPEASILTVHGQMDEKLMEQRMREFVNGDADILVSTTIIESGLDIPNVNTIFINCADTFGLADLHQLRGRVGRYKHHAFAYIILPADRPVTPVAERRIKAIKEFTALGAGFRIAMRDLEIRGAGNIVGIEQHGHIAAIGYEMYCRLLELAVKKARNEPVCEPLDVAIDIDLEAYIPNNYITESSIKMDIYRRLHRSATGEEIRVIAGEIKDRFGDLPQPVKNLIAENRLRVVAQHARIRSIVRTDNTLIMKFVDLKKAETHFRDLKKYIRIINEETMHLRIPKKKMAPEEVLFFLLKSISLQEGNYFVQS